MNRDAFEKLVGRAVSDIPERFRREIRNVAFLIADRPTQKQLAENNVLGDDALLGLYEGIPLTERGEYYGTGGTLPDRITVFQKAVEDAAREQGKDAAEIVRETIRHEVAHYFGMSEEEVERREKHIL